MRYGPRGPATTTSRAAWASVALADALAGKGLLVLGDDGGMVTSAGEAFLLTFGIDMRAVTLGRRAFRRPCLDRSERRFHLAGAVGAELASRCFDLDWIARVRDTRAVAITPTGHRRFAETFGIRG